MLRASGRKLAISATAVGTFGALWYAYNQRVVQPASETFQLDVRVRTPQGTKMTTRTMPLLSRTQVNAQLRKHAQSQSVRRPGGILWKYQTAFMAANDGIEDAHAQAIVEKDHSSDAPPGDLLFWAVMDGHGGPHTSRLLSKVLIPAVASEIASLIKSPLPIPTPPKTSLSYLKSFLSSTPPAEPNHDLDADPKYVSTAIKTAFAKLDSQIINHPIRLLSELTKLSPDTKPYEHPMAEDSMRPALSGACALLAMLDTARKDMYIACTGDSRAVAGYWDEPADGSAGSWRMEVLTEDQTGRNPNELKRIQSEHPSSEASKVIQRGRILGGLEPSRAFGDATYKWPRDVHAKLVGSLLPPGSSHRRVPTDLQTPPYVTSEPVITHRKLSFLPLSDPSSSSSTPTPKSTLKFVVLATDGLWDQLSSSEVISLVGGYMAGLKGNVPKNTLASTVKETQGAGGVEGKDKNRNKGQLTGSWAFEDDNVGTHLIRNAFGGADEAALARLVSIPPPLARSYRDDVTVTVLWWEDGHTQVTHESVEEQAVKAKL